MNRFHLFLLFLAVLLIGGCQRGPGDREVTAPLLEGLGTHTMPISTPVIRAQGYFDQGIVLAYGFNHEAARSFRAAQQLDPDCLSRSARDGCARRWSAENGSPSRRFMATMP